jgi:hypothetical protein
VHSRTSITPGMPWLDTAGNRIHAHGGSIIDVDGTFFWYGENKERTDPAADIWHWGVRCYSSIDLYNWEDRGLIIPPDLDDATSPLHPAAGMDRPHIIRDPRTGRFICWLKVMRPDSQLSTVLVADDILGPYTIVRRDFRPLGMNAGDFDLVVEPTDGKAYYYFERVHSELICADLTPDYTDVSGYYSTHFPRIQPPFVREAPAHFSRLGMQYLVTSGTTSYYPNPSEIATALTYHGPWTVQGDPHPADPSRTSFHSQISSVFRHPQKKDLYIALADRWLPHYLDDSSAAVAMHEQDFAPGGAIHREPGSALTHFDTAKADYVWLPFRFDGERAWLEWCDEWRIDEFD